MKKAIWKRCPAILVLLAFFAAALTPLVSPTAAAEPCAMMTTSSMLMESSSPHDCDKLPSTPAPPICGVGSSCFVMAAAPDMFAPIQFQYGRVAYLSVPSAQTGLSIEPDLFPPIIA